jgi:hypothetical protein
LQLPGSLKQYEGSFLQDSTDTTSEDPSETESEDVSPSAQGTQGQSSPHPNPTRHNPNANSNANPPNPNPNPVLIPSGATLVKRPVNSFSSGTVPIPQHLRSNTMGQQQLRGERERPGNAPSFSGGTSQLHNLQRAYTVDASRTSTGERPGLPYAARQANLNLQNAGGATMPNPNSGNPNPNPNPNGPEVNVVMRPGPFNPNAFNPNGRKPTPSGPSALFFSSFLCFFIDTFFHFFLLLVWLFLSDVLDQPPLSKSGPPTTVRVIRTNSNVPNPNPNIGLGNSTPNQPRGPVVMRPMNNSNPNPNPNANLHPNSNINSNPNMSNANSSNSNFPPSNVSSGASNTSSSSQSLKQNTSPPEPSTDSNALAKDFPLPVSPRRPLAKQLTIGSGKSSVSSSGNPLSNSASNAISNANVTPNAIDFSSPLSIDQQLQQLSRANSLPNNVTDHSLRNNSRGLVATSPSLVDDDHTPAPAPVSYSSPYSLANSANASSLAASSASAQSQSQQQPANSYQGNARQYTPAPYSPTVAKAEATIQQSAGQQGRGAPHANSPSQFSQYGRQVENAASNVYIQTNDSINYESDDATDNYEFGNDTTDNYEFGSEPADDDDPLNLEYQQPFNDAIDYDDGYRSTRGPFNQPIDMIGDEVVYVGNSEMDEQLRELEKLYLK